MMNWRRLIHCAGGLRCANIIAPELPPDLPPGTEILFEYTCGDCGTHYSWNTTTRKRTRIKMLKGRGRGVSIAAGETKEFVFLVPEDRRN